MEGVFLLGDTGVKAAGAESGAILGGQAEHRGQRGAGAAAQVPQPHGSWDPQASYRGQLPQPRFSTAVSFSPKYSADRAGIAKHTPPSSQIHINSTRPGWKVREVSRLRAQAFIAAPAWERQGKSLTKCWGARGER